MTTVDRRYRRLRRTGPRTSPITPRPQSHKGRADGRMSEAELQVLQSHKVVAGKTRRSSCPKEGNPADQATNAVVSAYQLCTSTNRKAEGARGRCPLGAPSVSVVYRIGMRTVLLVESPDVTSSICVPEGTPFGISALIW